MLSTNDPGVALCDALFLGFCHPEAAPMLQLEVGIDWLQRTVALPKHFLAPLSGPSGRTIGLVEFQFLTTAGQKARFAAIALHSEQSAARLSLPRLQALSPLPPGGI